jgi:hypothetical protein
MTPSSTTTFTFNFSQMLSNGDTLQAQFKRVDPASANTIRMDETAVWGGTSAVNFSVNTIPITTSSLLQTLRGELGQREFLKGIMTMFNLVTLPDENNPNNIKIEPYGDIFINNIDSAELDWTRS